MISHFSNFQVQVQVRDVKEKYWRHIHSFVRRAGRMTLGQKTALQTLWQQWGLNFTPGVFLKWDWTQIFGHQPERMLLEIGFGKGEALLDFAQQHPDWSCLGVEVHQPGLGALLQGIEQAGIENIRIAGFDVCRLLEEAIPEETFDEVRIFFPDPWPKKRHHKRRLIQRDFLNVLYSKVVPGGLVHLATDWSDYAEQMKLVFASDPRWLSLDASDSAGDLKSRRVGTRFEQRGLKLGYPIQDLAYIRRGE